MRQCAIETSRDENKIIIQLDKAEEQSDETKTTSHTKKQCKYYGSENLLACQRHR